MLVVIVTVSMKRPIVGQGKSRTAPRRETWYIDQLRQTASSKVEVSTLSGTRMFVDRSYHQGRQLLAKKKLDNLFVLPFALTIAKLGEV